MKNLRKTIFTVFLLASSIIVYGQTNVRVDERFELTGIAFRLTGIETFAKSVPKSYANDIDEYFDKYKEHELVKFLYHIVMTKKPFDMTFVVTSAADIVISGNNIHFSKNLITCYDLAPTIDTTNSEWTKAELEEYLRLLNKFYKDTKFHDFFVQHTDFYRTAEGRMQQIVNQINTFWFKSFFGHSHNLANVWVIPANGANNYSLWKQDKTGKMHFDCALGCSTSDSLGYPVFDETDFNVLVHEICHHYVNPICDKFWSSIESTCDSIFSFVSDELKSHHCGTPKAMFYESMNRLCEYSYLKMHPIVSEERMKTNMIISNLIGFVWLHEMIDFLEVLTNIKTPSPYFEDCMPQLIGFLQQVPQNMESYYLPKHRLLRPRILYTYPAANSIVDTDLDTIVISFSQPMQPFFAWWRDFADSLNIEIPPLKENEFWADDHTVLFPIEGPLKPHTKYGIPVSAYTSSTDAVMGKDFDLIFETR